MRSSLNLAYGTLLVCSLYISATAHFHREKSVQSFRFHHGNLLAREALAAPPPPFKGPPHIEPGKPKFPGPIGPPVQGPALVIPDAPPASYGIYLNKGEGLVSAFDSKIGPDIDHDYANKIAKYETKMPIPYEAAFPTVDLGQGPFPKKTPGLGGLLGVKVSDSWYKYLIKPRDSEFGDVSQTFHSPQQKSIIVAEIYNGRYIDTDLRESADRLPHGELIFGAWRSAAGDAHVADLQFVFFADIQDAIFIKIIDDARRLKDITTFENGGKITFTSSPEASQAEKDAFHTLAGMDVSKNVYYMLTDHKIAFAGKRPVAVHTYAQGASGGSGRHLGFELA